MPTDFPSARMLYAKTFNDCHPSRNCLWIGCWAVGGKRIVREPGDETGRRLGLAFLQEFHAVAESVFERAERSNTTEFDAQANQGMCHLRSYSR